MTYTVRVLLDLQFTKYMTVEADSEEEAVAKVNDASASEAFFDEMTENYDTQDMEVEGYLCEHDYRIITRLEDVLARDEEEYL